MPDQLSGDLKNRRVHQLAELETELRRDYFASLVGENVQVLVESERKLASLQTESTAHEISGTDRILRGTTCRYAPAEWVSENSNLQAGDLVNVTVQSSDGERLLVQP